MNKSRKYRKSRIIALLSGMFLLITTPLLSSCTDETEENDVLSILFEKSSVGISVSGTEQLRIKVILPGKGVSQTDWYDQTANPLGLVWSSGNENAVRVDTQGVITGIGTGNAPITVTAPNGVYARASVSVSNEAIFERVKALPDRPDCLQQGRATRPQFGHAMLRRGFEGRNLLRADCRYGPA